MLGTAAYLAPEQARGEEAGPRADLYSLGVVTYQLLSGRLPYEAQSLSELALKQQREAPTPLESLNPRVPHELAEAVEMALAIDQEARPANALLLAEALRNGARGDRPGRTRPARPHTWARRPRRACITSREQASEPPTAATRVATRAPLTDPGHRCGGPPRRAPPRRGPPPSPRPPRRAGLGAPRRAATPAAA